MQQLEQDQGLQSTLCSGYSTRSERRCVHHRASANKHQAGIAGELVNWPGSQLCPQGRGHQRRWLSQGPGETQPADRETGDLGVDWETCVSLGVRHHGRQRIQDQLPITFGSSQEKCYPSCANSRLFGNKVVYRIGDP